MSKCTQLNEESIVARRREGEFVIVQLNIKVDPIICWNRAVTKLIIIWEATILRWPSEIEVLEETSCIGFNFELLITLNCLFAKRMFPLN